MNALKNNDDRMRDPAARQRALLKAAMQLFASRGYEATTTREIAALAGCAEGLIHRYFQGKAGLLLALMHSPQVQDPTEAGQEHCRARNLEEAIHRLLEDELARHWNNRDFLRIAVSRGLIDPELGRSLGRVGPYRHVAAIKQSLLQHAAGERAEDDEEVEAVAQVIAALGFALGFVDQVVSGTDPDTLHRLVGAAASTLARGLESPSPVAEEKTGRARSGILSQ